MLLDKTDEQLLTLAADALTDIFGALDNGLWGELNHAPRCPQDDTCDCPAKEVAKKASDALNAIKYRLRFARGRKVALRTLGPTEAHEVKQLEGNQVVTTCNLIQHHEHFFPTVEVRGGVVLARGDIPNCRTCFPQDSQEKSAQDSQGKSAL